MSPKCTCSSGGGGKLAAVVVAGLVIASGAHAAGGHKPAAAAVVADAVGHPADAAEAAQAIAYAKAQLGKWYAWGGTGPAVFDCSGLTMRAWQRAGVSMHRTSQEQWKFGHKVGSPQPGDLVFFAGADGTRAAPGHVGIVLGGHWMVEAYATGYRIRVSQFGTAASAPGDGNPVGFVDPALGGD